MLKGLKKMMGMSPIETVVDDPLPGARMVREQLVPRGIHDPRVLELMARLDRRLFVGNELREHAFDDAALPTREGQTISQPYIVAVMTEFLDVKPNHRVLEIGTGTGYQTAILAELAREVVTIERDRHLAEQAAERIEHLGYPNVLFKLGDGFHGWPPEAPYDRIILTAAPRKVSQKLFQQLADGGVLVAPEGEIVEREGAQKLRRWRKTGAGGVEVEDLMDVRFVPLVPEEESA